jgi:outer membrane protein assembly factor BamB
MYTTKIARLFPPASKVLMSPTRFSICQLALLASSLIPATVHAADWPRWGGRDDCNMISCENGLPESFEPGRKSPQGIGIDMSTTQNVKWVARLGTQTLGNPTVANGRIYVGTNDEGLDDPRIRSSRGGVVMCLDEATGRLLWQLIVPKFQTNQPLFNFDNMGLGVCSSPTLEGDRVYLVTNRCEVVCLDAQGLANGNDGPFKDEGRFIAGPGRPPVRLQATDADILWKLDLIHDLDIWVQDAANCSILVHGDFLYVCTSNGVDRSHTHVPRPLAPSLIVLDKKTGRLVASDDEHIGTRLFHGQWSSPSLGVVNGKPLVFFGGGDGVLYAFEPLTSMPKTPVKLKKVFSYDCNPPEYKVVNGRPVAYFDGDIRKHRLNNNDGTFVGFSEIIGTPVFYKNRVYVTIGQDPSHGRGVGMLTCIDATQTGDVTGKAKVWSYPIGRSLSSPSIVDGLLYVADTFEGVYCFDAETGKPYWRHPTGSEVWGSTLVADGKIYLGTKKSLLVLAAGKEDKLLATVHLGTPAYCTPVVANGVLYVASQRYLWAVQAAKNVTPVAKAR